MKVRLVSHSISPFINVQMRLHLLLIITRTTICHLILFLEFIFVRLSTCFHLFNTLFIYQYRILNAIAICKIKIQLVWLDFYLFKHSNRSICIYVVQWIDTLVAIAICVCVSFDVIWSSIWIVQVHFESDQLETGL